MATFHEALIKSYEAEVEEAKAVLKLYLNNVTAVADHTEILKDLREWTAKLSEAEENLKTAKSL